MRLCKICRTPFSPARVTHRHCQAACRKTAHRLRAERPAPEPAARLLAELHSLQESAGLDFSQPHAYLDRLAELKYAERQLLSAQRRFGLLKQALTGIAEPPLKVRIQHLDGADSALEQPGRFDQWVGIYATDEGAVLILGNVRTAGG